MENILEYLEQTAAKYPEHTAVEHIQDEITWSGLLNLSKNVGSALCTRTQMHKPIVILMEKSIPTLAAMFGTVYAGCFYVMLDPSQPRERMQKIFDVLNPAIVITNAEHRDTAADVGYQGEICLIDTLTQEKTDESALSGVREKSRGTDLLYGIFTSGSTGVPKCITVSHRAVMDFIGHFVTEFGFSGKDRIGNQAPFDFDVSVKDIYTSVMTGASLILIPTKYFSTPAILLDYLCDKKVNTLIWAVSALTLVSALKGLRYRVPTDVTRIMFSGEVMPVKQLRQWQKALPDAEYVNLYGPSEITCNCTFYRITREFDNEEKIPIGQPFAGRKVFLLNDNDEVISEPDQAGEICVAGESISEGYYHNPEETKKRFIEEASGYPAFRYYRTGDLGYYDAEHQLYFSGRKDFQIKHMGHRIELEEIEHVLSQIDGLERSCCVFDTRRNRIIAFYLGDLTEEDIRKQLGHKIPAYMIPHRFIQTDVMPLTKNGKTDRKYFMNQLEVKKA